MADPTTEILFACMRTRAKRIAFACGFATVVVVPWLWWADTLYENPYPLASLMVIAWILTAVGLRLWIVWVFRAEKLLRTQAWRPVDARVDSAGLPSLTSIIECDDEDSVITLRVSRLDAAHLALIEETGRVWLVGPDERGWASVRLDGSHAPFPARRVKAVKPDPVVKTGDVTRLTAARMRFQAFLHLRWILALLAWAVLLAVLTAEWFMVISPVLALVTAFGIRAHNELIDRRLRALVAGAEWVELPVLMAPWVARAEGTARARAAVGLPGGRTLTMTLPNASVDLLGTAYETGTLWFSAPPEPGKTVAVGFPGYPLLAVARCA